MRGGGSYNGVLGLSAFPELEAPTAGRCILLRILEHDRKPLARALDIGTIGSREFVQLGYESTVIGVPAAVFESHLSDGATPAPYYPMGQTFSYPVTWADLDNFVAQVW